MTVSPFERLRTTVDLWKSAFAIVDGAKFEDLPADLKRHRIFARSLFINVANQPVERAGPWLIGLDQAPDTAAKVHDLVAERDAAVFWSCDTGQQVLFRHLRTLNAARIPTWAANGFSSPEGVDDPGGQSVVSFRHWDPSVLASFLPVLDPAQFMRFLGPADEIAFVDAATGFRRARPIADVSARGGMLTIRPEQIVDLAERRSAASNRRIAAYLRDVAPAQTVAMTDVELLNYAEEAQSSGRILGLRDERALGVWSYMMMASNGEIARSRDVRLYIGAGAASPDRQLFRLVDGCAAAASAEASL